VTFSYGLTYDLIKVVLKKYILMPLKISKRSKPQLRYP